MTLGGQLLTDFHFHYAPVRTPNEHMLFIPRDHDTDHVVLLQGVPYDSNFRSFHAKMIQLFIVQRLRQIQKTLRVPGFLAGEDIKEIHGGTHSFRFIPAGMVMNSVGGVEAGVEVARAGDRALAPPRVHPRPSDPVGKSEPGRMGTI